MSIRLLLLAYASTFLLHASAQVSGSPRAPAPPNTQTIQLCVENIDEAVGMIWVGIYTSEENFLIKEKARLIGVRVDTEGQAMMDLPDMEVGQDYALAVFHDVDNDGDMNRNWLGLPSEPWAFSGKVRTRLRLPTFEEVKFTVRPELTKTSLRLRMI